MENKTEKPLSMQVFEAQKEMVSAFVNACPEIGKIFKALFTVNYLNKEQRQQEEQLSRIDIDMRAIKHVQDLLRTHEARLKMAEAEVEFEKKHGRPPFVQVKTLLGQNVLTGPPVGEYDPHAHIADRRVQTKPDLLGPGANLPETNTAFDRTFKILLEAQKNGTLEQILNQHANEKTNKKGSAQKTSPTGKGQKATGPKAKKG